MDTTAVLVQWKSIGLSQGVTNLVSTPIPRGRNGDTEEDTRPRKTAVVSGAYEMQGVIRRNTTAELSMIHSILNRRVWNCAQKVVHYGIKPAGLHKSCITSKSLSYVSVHCVITTSIWENYSKLITAEMPTLYAAVVVTSRLRLSVFFLWQITSLSFVILMFGNLNEHQNGNASCACYENYPHIH